MQKEVFSKIIPLLIGAVFVVLVVVALLVQWYVSPVNESAQIVQDLVTLSKVLQQIDRDATIIGFDHQKNWINFLQIKKDGFVGSEVGSVNLAYPEKWNGPYMQDNPTIQDKEYMVIQTKQGYFIAPGVGVKLPNNKVIGTDIKLDEESDIMALMNDTNALLYDTKRLAVPLQLSKKNRRAVPLPVD